MSRDILSYLGIPPRLPQEDREDYSRRIKKDFYQKVLEWCQFNISMGVGSEPKDCTVEQFSTAVTEMWIGTFLEKFEEIPVEKT